MNFSEFIRHPEYEGWQLLISEKQWGYNLASTFEQAVMVIGWHRAGCTLHARLLCNEVEHGTAQWLVLADGTLRVRKVEGAVVGLAEQYNKSMCTLGRSYPISLSMTSQGGTNETDRDDRNHRRARSGGSRARVRRS